MKRLRILFTVYEYDFIFIHREASPIGPPVIEWIIAKVLRKKIIYDFDDAIWFTDRINESGLLKILKWRSKVSSICRWSYKVSCGNSYLMNYAKQFNSQVVYNPTTIDTDNLHNPELYAQRETSDTVIIGWTGSHSTLKYLEDLEPVLKKLEAKYANLNFLVIADRPPELALHSLLFAPWSKETEIKDLLKFDIGIMPLPDDEWSNGKCGFKALQYMAMEIPTVASPVGVNSKIIDVGVNGFIATTNTEWITLLEDLIQNIHLRKKIGLQARRKIIEDYSLASNTSNFLSLFE